MQNFIKKKKKLVYRFNRFKIFVNSMKFLEF